MDINRAWFELVLESLNIGLKHKHITKEEYKQHMKDAMEILKSSNEEIKEQVELYTEWRNNNGADN